MVISRLPSGGGGSKELHGAIINVSTGASLVGQTVYLYKSDSTEVAHKVVPSTKAVSFTDVQEVDTYTIKVTYQSKEYSDDIEITAEDIVDKNTFSASILGASVTVATTEATLSGQKVELYLIDSGTETKVSEGTFSAELTYKFESIFTSGSYKVKSGEFESDEVAISDDDVSQNANKNILLSTSVTLALTLEGACEDNIKIYDDTNTQVASCVFASGQTTGTVELTIPAEGGTYKFESTVAKDTTSGTSNYTKNVDLTDSSSDVKVMPDSALYWYGNECTDVTGGWSNSGYMYSTTDIKAGTKNTNNMYVFGKGQGTFYGLGTVFTFNTTPFQKICVNGKSVGSENMTFVCEVLSAKANTAYNFLKQVLFYKNESTIKTLDISSINQQAYFITYSGNDVESARSGNAYAVWLE